MDSVHIHGGVSLMGEVTIQGAKNGALPLLTATILIQGQTTLHNCPGISDIDAMLDLLQEIGCIVTRTGAAVTVDAKHIRQTSCPARQVKAMRSSVMLLGPMLGRCGQIRMHRPGGCIIGKRPMDIHESALAQMNVSFQSQADEIYAVTQELTGADITLAFPSVEATENVIMAAVLAKGVTRLYNGAREPEIQQLCLFLTKAGARIKMLPSHIEIRGVEQLHEVTMEVMPDRIVTGTYLLAAAATRGQIIVRNAPTSQLHSLLQVLGQIGARLVTDEDIICMDAQDAVLPVPYIKTEVYPGFPTDLQSMLSVLLTLARGDSIIEETIFEDRFKIAQDLTRMGAQLTISGRQLRIHGVECLYGKRVQARELRGGAALIIAGLCSRGETVVENCRYMKRGYEDICRDLKALSADIEYV